MVQPLPALPLRRSLQTQTLWRVPFFLLVRVRRVMGALQAAQKSFSIEIMRAAAGMAGKVGKLSAALKLLADGFPEAVGDDGGVVGFEINRIVFLVFPNRGFEQAAVTDIGLILQDVEDVAVGEGRSVPGQDTLGGEETADLLDGGLLRRVHRSCGWRRIPGWGRAFHGLWTQS